VDVFARRRGTSRRKGSSEAVRERREAPPVVVGDWSAESGYVQGATLCGDPGVTAVFAVNDQMALGLLRALRELGRTVPGDASVVAFDDMAEAAHFWPP
jgi:DNA-binding LacI/PurR family transcriptional regulator